MACSPELSRQPLYRRPSWAQNHVSYATYMRKNLAADRSPGSDYGMENFSYDETHLDKWHVPTHLLRRLPSELRDAALDWQYAGAAVCTALDRITRLDRESIYRAYPEKCFSHLSRDNSQSQSPVVAGSDTPPLSSPVSPNPQALPTNLPLDKWSQLPQADHPLGMDSPPFTPADSNACPTPEVHGDSPAWKPDVQQLNRQLSPLSVRADSITGAVVLKPDFKDVCSSFSSAVSSSSSSPPLACFDENAWETFLNIYRAELTDLRQTAWPRFKGCGYSIDKVRIECGSKPELKSIVNDFNDWWASTKSKVAEYQVKVKELDAPTIEFVKLERMAKGLPV